jgi:putative ABC transport system permease protein
VAPSTGTCAVTTGALTDLRLAVRGFRREPAWTAAVLLTLAAGIGAATATQAVFNVALFRPVPGVAAPDSLVTIYFQPADRRPIMFAVSDAHLEAIRSHVPAFSGVASCQPSELVVQARASDAPRTVDACRATRGYFDVLGVRARAGRLFAPDEADTRASTVALISERLWRSLLAEDRAAIGRDVLVNGDRFTVIGVVAAFQGEQQLGTTDLWLPFRDGASQAREGVHQTMVARLRPGTRLAEAQAQVAVVFAGVEGVAPSVARGVSVESPGARTRAGMPTVPVVYAGLNNGPGTLTRARLLAVYETLLAGVALLLLLACANTANLLLARNVRRRRELAIRAAIGASRTRLFQQLLVECLVLATSAAAVGFGFGAALAGLFRGTRILSYLPALDDLAVDWRVATFAAATGVATVLVFGLGPGLSAARADPQLGLRESSRTTRAGGRWQGALMGAQLSLSLALLAAAGVLVETVSNLRSLDLGVDPSGVVTFTLKPYILGADATRADAIFRDVLGYIETTPGVESAAVTEFSPFGENQYVEQIREATQPAGSEVRVIGSFVSPHYFATLRIPVLAGRAFIDADRAGTGGAGAGVAVVSATLARRLFGAAPAVGRRVVLKEFKNDETDEVVGVVGDVRSNEIRSGIDPVVYRPAAEHIRVGTVLMRTPLPTARAVVLAEQAVRAVDPGLPLNAVSTVRDDVERLIASERILAKVAGLLALFGALFATTGVSAVVTFVMSQRTREFGIRMALGATATVIIGGVLRGVFLIASASAVAGLGLVAASSRLLASRVFGVSSLDPGTLVGATGLLLAAALVAAGSSARRAVAINPTVALRAE